MKRRGRRGRDVASRRIRAGATVLAASLLPAVAALGQARATEAPPGRPTETPQGRPSVGLVLSGGGAGGMAHIGVIEWFEENRIPIDMIAGTSLGGLVGGIYATGDSARDMRDLVNGIDWQVMLSSDVPYEHRSFRRKEDAREAPAGFELGLRGGFSLPFGLNGGHQVGLMLDRIALPYAQVGSFDRLPTPFACVAVDLASGEEVVFRSGSLAVALRATMSYPGWFTPVRTGEQVLVDGGALNNLPTDVMADMGADVIVGVDLETMTAEVETFDDVLGVLNRTVSVMMRNNTDRRTALADVLIRPDVSQLEFTDFNRADEIIRIGYEAAQRHADELAPYALDEVAWSRYRDGRAERRRVFRATPRFIEVEGATSQDHEAVLAALDHHLGTALDAEHLHIELTRIAGWGRYDTVGYRGLTRTGEQGLGVTLRPKTHGPPFLLPIIDLRGSEFGEALVELGGRFTFFDVAGLNSELRLDASYGQRTGLFSDLYVPIGHQGLFVAARFGTGFTRQSIYVDDEAVASFEIGRAGGGFDVGYTFGPRSELRFGVEAEHQDAKIEVGQPLLDPLSGTAASVRARWAFEGVNSSMVPTRGARIDSEARWFFASPDFVLEGEPVPSGDRDDRFLQARVETLGARPIGGRFYVIGSAAGGTSFDATASPPQQFLLGGPLQLSALGLGELRGSHFFLGRAGVLWALADENRLSFFGTFYVAALYEVGDAFESKPDPLHDVAFGLAGETLLGGVFVGAAVGQDGRAGFFFALGRIF